MNPDASAFANPGVAIKEIPTGISAITGVPTAIAAFVGWANQGPLAAATLVQSWSDFASQFGGLDSRSYLGYAVNQFFANGGQQAYIIRLAWDGSLSAAPGTSPAPCAPAAAPAVPLGTVISATVNGISGYATLGVTSATLTAIALTPPNSALPVGESQTLTATGTYSDGSMRDLTTQTTWASTPAGLVTLNGSIVTGASVGSAAVTAACSGVNSGAVTIEVVAAPTLTSIAASPAATSLPPGVPQIFSITGTFSDGTQRDVTSRASLAAAPTGVARLNGATAIGAAAGAATITVTVPGAPAAKAKLTVTAATLASLALAPASLALPIGADGAIKATATYSDGSTYDVTAFATWLSTAAPKATVAAGKVSGVANGTAGISASWGGQAVSASVSVTAPALISIVVVPATATSPLGFAQAFTATGTYSDGSTQNLSAAAAWASGTPAAARITSAGSPNPGTATALAATGSLALSAKNRGAWGNTLRLRLTVPAANPGRFSLQVLQVPSTPGGSPMVLENFVNLSTSSTDASGVVAVINSDSQYLAIADPSPGSFNGTPLGLPGTSSPLALSGGADGAVLTPATDGNFERVLAAGGPPGGSPTPPIRGLYLLERVPIFNLLCVPGETDAPTIRELQSYCSGRRAFLIVDAPSLATTANLIQSGPVGSTPGSLTGSNAGNSAYYYPWVIAPDPLESNRSRPFPPCGCVAGVYAAADASHGVWKSPAGIGASLTGITGLQSNLTDLENGSLNVQAINCLRQLPTYGYVAWGARTLLGNDQAASPWKYLSIRRFALFLESSLDRGTKWAVFEPNDETLWGQIRLQVGTFLQGLFLQGAFQGASPAQAYFVKCDGENNPPSSVAQGLVTIVVGFAPLTPAEFVVIQIQQIAGQTSA
jgi:phage tail sheath protein FI